MTLIQLVLFAAGLIATLVIHDVIGDLRNTDISVKLAVIVLIFIAGLYASGNLLSFATGAAVATAGLTTYRFGKRIADRQRAKEKEAKEFDKKMRRKLELDDH